MSSELRDILPRLDPPPGGVERLRARLQRGRVAVPSRAVPRWAAIAVAAALLLAVLARGQSPAPRPPVAAADPVMLALAGDAPPLRVLDARAAAGRVALGRDDVLYYRVVSASP